MTKPRTIAPAGARFYKWVVFPYHDHWLLEIVAACARAEFDLVKGKRVTGWPAGIDLGVVKPGKEMDFSTAVMGVPVASPRAAALLRRIAPDDVQLIPCRIDGADRGFSVVNVVSLLDSVDRKRSRVIVPAGGGLRAMHGWVIDPAKAEAHVLFRLKKDPMALVVGEALKDEIERQKMVGPGLVELDGEVLRNVMPGYEP
jgi:hypothetical protein